MPAAREVSLNPRCEQVAVFSQKNYAVSRSTQPSALRGTVNEYQRHG